MGITLTILETSGIQSYVFASNRLSHHVAASYLVEKATGEWLEQARAGLGMELVYCGGGNAVLLFDTPEQAIAMTQNLTTRVLMDAPSLRLHAAHRTFDWQKDPLSAIYQETLKELARKKWQHAPPLTLLGQSVTALCSYTSLPAADIDKDADAARVRYLSAEIVAKSNCNNKAKEALRKKFEAQLGHLDFIDDFDKYGDKDEHNYLAVVHADGNGMGSRKQALCEKYKNASQNCELVEALRTFSDEVNGAGRDALKKTVEMAVTRRKRDDKEKFLKFTPIIYGGDDATFVCDGDQGLALAERYLAAFGEECDKTTLLQGAQACAGVAVVKTRFPFARAYGIAADLCASAKTRARKRDGAYLDWHFAVNGAVRRISDIRAREYQVDAGSLTLRPVSINPRDKELDSWTTFKNNVDAFAKIAQEKRSKIKELRSVLRDGPEAVHEFLDMFGMGDLPEIDSIPSAECRTKGWHAGFCVYFDAIEAMEHVDLEPSASAEGAAQ